MTVEELKKRLEADNIPRDMYSLLIGGFPNESFCLVKNEANWEVYYSERGNKRGAKHFEKEAEACEYLYKKLSRYSEKV